ncbi:hypothetical protein AU156_gp196 [Edwardsiella phage PEi20]|uniref:Uncharacterized protein n=1 Tax=Edwardsiella phage PEi20 TaxID=1608310 RepID=A0A0B6VSV5_9CAUD|nr:hypothetical protein AU156_gp196 [Edwardsiella phage PEi20]BAQ22905.1 hypothetical protein [Edwardsiella phage PEi20]
MITVVEYRDDQGEYNLQTAFSVKSADIAKEHFSTALENSSNECQYPWIAVTIYADDGMTYIDGDIFKTTLAAFEWWEERCSN